LIEGVAERVKREDETKKQRIAPIMNPESAMSDLYLLFPIFNN
jgi:hypothetical protein